MTTRQLIHEDNEVRIYEVSDGGKVIGTDTERKLTASEENERNIRQQALAALANNREFIASTPTAGQTAAQVKALTRQMNGVIRLVLGHLDGDE